MLRDFFARTVLRYLCSLMEREIQITADGSHTVAIPGMQVTYHSKHGAIQESMHVFIQAGLSVVPASSKVHVLEMGFGTGLNALLTLEYALQHLQPVSYTSFELYPLSVQEAALLNYAQQLPGNTSAIAWNPEALFTKMHAAAWEETVDIHPLFQLHKTNQSLLNLPTPQSFSGIQEEEATAQLLQWSNRFHVIYYDAFAPNAQPELWTAELFAKLLNTLLPGGILVTYCSKGDVRRAMQAAGFTVAKIPGPPGKREMLRATKPV